jgi:hypothetical protein
MRKGATLGSRTTTRAPRCPGTFPLLVALVTCLLTVVAVAPAPAHASGPGTRGKVAGFGVTTAQGGVRAITLEAERIAAVRGNTVSLEATWEVDSQDSNEPRRSSYTVSDEDLLLAARRVREQGMNVMMTVKVACLRCTGHPSNRWRGTLQPSNRDVFYANYRAMTNHYAELAQRAGAVLYFVGSEMNTLQGDTGAWRQVVFEARQRFSGNIGYQANWDALTGIGFWDEIDVAGVSAYFPLSDELQPNISDLVEAWSDSDTKAHRGSNWVQQLEDFARSHGKPVLFGEVGYQSAIQAAQRPFHQDKTSGYDGQLQSDLYQTVLTVFEPRRWWLGAIWWEYKITSADEKDLDYSPRGKLAEQLLTSWYSGNRPASPGQSLVGTTRPSARADGQPKATGPAEPPTSGPGASAPRPQAPAAPAAPAAQSAGPTQAAPLTAPLDATGEVTEAPAPDVAGPTEAALQRREPELPEVLRDVQPQTVEEALVRAAEREHRERMSVAAGGLLGSLLLGHAVLAGRRLRRPDIFSR